MHHAYAGKLLRVTLLAPDLVEAVLDSKQPRGMTAQELVREVPVGREQGRFAQPKGAPFLCGQQHDEDRSTSAEQE